MSSEFQNQYLTCQIQWSAVEVDRLNLPGSIVHFWAVRVPIETSGVFGEPYGVAIDRNTNRLTFGYFSVFSLS